MKRALLAAAAIAAVTAAPAMAQNRNAPANQANSPAVAYLSSVPADQQPDVVLDVPNLSVDEITLKVDNLQVRVALDAQLASLLKLSAGADASIDQVELSIKGVKAQAALIVRLDNVRAIIERTLQTLDNNPQIVEQLTGTVDNAVGVTGGVVNNTVSTVGDLTRGVLSSGRVLDLASSGLSVVSSTVNSAGDTVRRLRGSDGGLYDVVTDTAGKILRSTRVGG
ncbi:hypothetical protein [Tsuneonella amylolytica]|uniref:hypothetical protein n=1 Tax=Tsuneonella amylolytica TaxID=2338327 RepID=UPI000EAA3AD0|nr:hypothetical protein [Tsuneonella amylolytica]